jgi:hypothetical protein
MVHNKSRALAPIAVSVAVMLAGCATNRPSSIKDGAPEPESLFSRWHAIIEQPRVIAAADTVTEAPVMHVESRSARMGLVPIPWPQFRDHPPAGTYSHGPQPVAVQPPSSHAPHHSEPDAPPPPAKAETVPPATTAKATEPVAPAPPAAPIVKLEPHQPTPPAAPPAVARPLAPAATPPTGDLPTTPAAARQRAAQLLKLGRIEPARRILSLPAVGADPGVITALAETYDPLVLAAYPSLAASADVAKARQLYLLAVAKGNQDALKRLTALEAGLKQ